MKSCNLIYINALQPREHQKLKAHGQYFTLHHTKFLREVKGEEIDEIAQLVLLTHFHFENDTNEQVRNPTYC